MVNWQDPAVQLFSAHSALYISTLCTGIYLWEFVLAFDFDWQFVTRRRPFRWTLLPYLFARYACAGGLVISIYPNNVFSPNGACRIWCQLTYAGAHIAVASASFLLVIRVIAIAGHNKSIAVFLVCFWLAEVGTLVHGFSTIDGIYVPELLACAVTKTVESRLNMLVSFSLNITSLIIVILLLLRTRAAGLWMLLLSQGIIYFVVVMIAYTSPTVLLLLNLNDGVNLSLQVPSLVALVICATRMYRGLILYNDQTMGDAFTMTSTQICWQAKARPGAGGSIVMPRSFVAYGTTDDDTQVSLGQELVPRGACVPSILQSSKEALGA